MKAYRKLQEWEENGANVDLNDIENTADINTREKFEMNEPIHKWEAYYIGDADEETLNEIAKTYGCDDYHELLSRMDDAFDVELERLCEEKLSTLQCKK